MYQKKDADQLEFENFYLPFSGKLNKENRWVKLAAMIPWCEIEERYMELFSPDQGAPAKPLRMALGALIIKERCGYTDEETVEQIRENPYLQYFIGMSEYRDEAPFEASMMVHYRKRLSADRMREINDMITGVKRESKSSDGNDSNDDDTKPGNQGKLIVDATCTPSDIRYPNDMSLLNEGREKTERIIDVLCEERSEKKPRTYRKVARKDFIRFIHLKKPDRKKVRKAIGKQLRYVNRNLKNIEKMSGSLDALSKKEYRDLLVVQELYRQQKAMYDAQIHHAQSRIVSISQPHVRPIVRGKAGASVEFGAKIELALVDGYAFIDHLSWENFNESSSLKAQIEQYRTRYGRYPASVHADKIFRTRDNRKFCKENGIQLSGLPLGRPRLMSKEEKRQIAEDGRIRNAIEGKFGQGKRRFGLSRIMAKLQETSECVIWLNIIVMNLERRLAILLLSILRQLHCIIRPYIGYFYRPLGVAGD